MDLNGFNSELLSFLAASPSPFHAVRSLCRLLDAAGFEALDEQTDWHLQPDRGYYVVRNGSSLVAFRTAQASPLELGIRMVGAHTDSPCLRVKPKPELHQQGFFQIGVEVYGGALLNPWFDRDLSMAGRVSFVTESGRIETALVDFRRPVAVVPSLAIHLDREANNSRSINAQRDLPPVLMLTEGDRKEDFREILRAQLQMEHPERTVRQVLDYEISLYDTQPAQAVGLRGDFITSARLDNLLSCYTGVRALIDAPAGVPALLVCNDHEEVGSMSAEGAQGPFLASVIERWVGLEHRDRVMLRSMMISADNAHGVHPNFSDRHECNHGPILNRGPVIKVNNNQRYATNSVTSAVYRQLSETLGLPYQVFVVRSDMACGSTIGPLTAGHLGVRTLDIGVPQLGMHSIREMVGAQDAHTLYQVLKAFNGCVALPDVV